MTRQPPSIETAVGGNAHLPATERPAEHRRPDGAPPDEVDAINEKAFAGGRPDALERPYDPGGLSEVNDQPERRVETSPTGYDATRDGPPHGIEGGPSVPNFDRTGANASGEAEPRKDTAGARGRSGNSSKPV